MIPGSFDEWKESVLLYSAILLDEYKQYQSSDIDDWEGKAWAVVPHIGEQKKGIILEGEKGQGKHTALASFLIAFEEYGYSITILDQSLLPDDTDEFRIFQSYIDQLVLENDSGNYLLVIDDIDSSECGEKVLNTIPFLCNRYSSEHVESQMAFIAISNKPLSLSSLLARMTNRFVLSKPTSEQRRRMIIRRNKDIEKLLDPEELISKTDSCSYKDLDDIISFMEIESVSNEKNRFNSEEIERIIGAYVEGPKHDAQEIGLSDLYLQKMIQSVANATEDKSSEKTDTKETDMTLDDVLNKRTDIESLPPRQLAYDLFGAEYVDNKIANYGVEE